MVAELWLSAVWLLACLAPVFKYPRMEPANAIDSALLAEHALA